MAKKDLPSPEVLRQLLRYELDTGKLFWRERGLEWFNSPAAMARWNGKHAGREALRCVHGHGYPKGVVLGVSLRAHRVAWAITFGTWPDVIDHIDGDVANNAISNLRNVTQAENNRNASRRKDNKSGVVGVYRRPASGKWIATIGDPGTGYLGIFDCFGRAVAARRAAELEQGFHRNHGRV